MPLIYMDPNSLWEGQDFSRNILAADANRRAQEEQETLQLRREQALEQNALNLQRQQDMMERPLNVENPQQLTFPEGGAEGPPMPTDLSLQQRIDRSEASLLESRARQAEFASSQEQLQRYAQLDVYKNIDEFNKSIEFLMNSGKFETAMALFQGISPMFAKGGLDKLLIEPTEENFNRIQAFRREQKNQLARAEGASSVQRKLGALDEADRLVNTASSAEDKAKALEVRKSLYQGADNSSWWIKRAEEDSQTRAAFSFSNMEELDSRISSFTSSLDEDEIKEGKQFTLDGIAKAVGGTWGIDSGSELMDSLYNRSVTQFYDHATRGGITPTKAMADRQVESYQKAFAKSQGVSEVTVRKPRWWAGYASWKDVSISKPYTKQGLNTLLALDANYANKMGLGEGYVSPWTLIAVKSAFGDDTEARDEWWKSSREAIKNAPVIK